MQTNHSNMRTSTRLQNIITPTLVLDTLSGTALFYIVYTVAANGYPAMIELLTVPYVVVAASLAMALHVAIESRHWLNAGLYAAGLLTICGLA